MTFLEKPFFAAFIQAFEKFLELKRFWIEMLDFFKIYSESKLPFSNT